MRLLTRYLFKTVLTSSLLVFFLFFVLELFIFLMGELTRLRAGYGVRAIGIYVLSMLPSLLYLSLPIILLLGSLIGLGRLAVKSELVVMLASGLSKVDIIKIVLLSASIFLLISMPWGEWLGPKAQHFATQYKAMKLGEDVSDSGLWLREGDDFLHVQRFVGDDEAVDVVRFHFNDQHELETATHAKKAVLSEDAWGLSDLNITRFEKDGTAVVEHLSETIWPISVDFKLIMDQAGGSQKTLLDLYRYIRYKKSVGMSFSQDAFSFWQRVLQPFATLLMIALGAPFIFGSQREHGMGFRITMGVLMALGFYTLNAFFGPISLLFHLSPFLAAVLPSVLLAGLGGALLARRHYVH